jgi:hypothetical protein
MSDIAISDGTFQTIGIRLIVLAFLFVSYFAVRNFLRLKGVPGPKTYALTKWRLAYDDWTGTRTRTIHQLPERLGTGNFRWPPQAILPVPYYRSEGSAIAIWRVSLVN